MVKKEVTFNPSLMLGVGLFPLVVVCVDFKSAVIFGLILFFVMMLSQMLVGAFRLIIPKRVRFVCYCLAILSVIYFVDSLINEMAPKSYDSIHSLIVYILASSIVIYNIEQNKDVENFGVGLKNTAIVGGCYFATMFIVGLIREIVGAGSIWGNAIFNNFAGIKFISTFAGGLLVVVIIALIYNTISYYIKKRRKIYNTLVKRYTKVLEEGVNIERVEESLKNEVEEER